MNYLKLMLILVFVFTITVSAQDNVPNVEANTDKPITTAWWHDISVKLVNNDMYEYFGWQDVYDILNGLVNDGPRDDNAQAINYYLDAQVIADINYFLGKFQPSSEVYSQALGQGDTAYVTEFGEIYSPETENYYSTDFQNVINAGSYNVYAGRNTSLDEYGSVQEGISQLELTTHGRKYTINMYANTTPLVLDLDGNNKIDVPGGSWLPATTNKNAKFVPFDMTGDGFEDLVEWMGPNDGLLIVYKGSANVNGLDLFGSAGGFTHGYEKLSLLDKNNDGAITDNELNTLSVWQDKNVNGLVDSGEVKSVKELGITSISLKHHHLASSFVQNGQMRKMWDWNPVTVLVKKRR